MLYPREDRQEKALYLACRNCEHFEESADPIVHTTNLKRVSAESTLNLATAKDIASDPTFRRVFDRACDKCNKMIHAVFPTRDKDDDSALALTYICCRCFTITSSNY